MDIRKNAIDLVEGYRHIVAEAQRLDDEWGDRLKDASQPGLRLLPENDAEDRWFRWLTARKMEELIAESSPEVDEPTRAENRLAMHLVDAYGRPAWRRWTMWLHQLKLEPGWDIDVVLICDAGLWVFEAKYWQGLVAHVDGQWVHRRSYKLKHDASTVLEKPVDDAPDDQWRREAKALTKHLQAQVPQVLERVPDLLPLRGGLAFTYPDTVLDIESGCPVAWGTPEQWAQRLKDAPKVEGFGREERLQVIESLLRRNAEIDETVSAPLSGLDEAREIVAEMEKGWAAWIETVSSQ